MRGHQDRPQRQPPRVPAFLLYALPHSHRSHIVGDLSEEFCRHASRGLTPRLARLWFWKELALSILANMLARLRYRLRGGLGPSGDRQQPDSNRTRNPFSGFGYDLRFAVRGLMKNPTFAIGAVVMLALGIGVNTAIFSLNAGMLRIVQRFHQPDELVFIWGTAEGWNRAAVSTQDYLHWREQADAFQEMGLYRTVARYVTGESEPRRVRAVQTSAGLLQMLGLDVERGRLHGVVDEAAAAPAVAVLTYRFWQERYGGDPALLGRTIRLNDEPYTVVGVLPAKVEFEILWHDADLFTPLILDPAELNWEDRYYRVVARLAEGSSPEQAQAQMTAIAARLAEAQPETNADVSARVEPFADHFYSADDKLAVVSLLLAVFAVLLIACVNLANLLLAKGTARQSEIAIRLAVGASRGRVVRQLLTESLLLSLTGGASGIVLGIWGLKLLLSSLPSTPFLPEEVGLDPLLLAYTLLISVGAALAFGLTPALLASRVSLSESIKEGGAGKSASRGRKQFRNTIMVAQLALTVPLVLSCVVGYRQVQTLGNLDFGFATEGLLVAQVDLPAYRFEHAVDRSELYEALVAEVYNIPGVTAAAASQNVPIGAGYRGMYRPFVIEGREAEEGSERGPRGFEVVSPEYFEAIGVSLRRGRGFTAADGPGDPAVAIVNEALVRRYWPGQDPVGKRLIPDTASAPWDPEHTPEFVTVVGVVADFGATFYGDPPNPAVYMSHLQQPPYDMKLIARTASDPLSLAPALRSAVIRIDAGVPLSQIRTGPTLIDDWLQESRTVAASLGVLGLLALGMAVLGLYGMVAYSVAQRTFELGVRMVLGADVRAIRWAVMRSFVTLAGVGLSIGLIISGIGGLVTRSQLVMLRIPIFSTVAGLVVLLSAIVLLASYLPARRATSIEPVQALRCE
ncbi:MAG: ABC transporter permease [Gemmatimonadota bacterium]|nr:MAG: ABC transporter permease [Gemmatimonadota bacterium]